MKISMIFLAMCFAGAVQAAERQKFVCNEYDRKTEKLKQTTVVLNQTGAGKLSEGEEMAFRLDIYDGASVTANANYEGHVLTEDVSFEFKSEDGDVRFHIYMDEMNESGLTIGNSKSVSFICR